MKCSHCKQKMIRVWYCHGCDANYKHGDED